MMRDDETIHWTRGRLAGLYLVLAVFSVACVRSCRSETGRPPPWRHGVSFQFLRLGLSGESDLRMPARCAVPAALLRGGAFVRRNHASLIAGGGGPTPPRVRHLFSRNSFSSR